MNEDIRQIYDNAQKARENIYLEHEHLTRGLVRAFEALYAIACQPQPWEREDMVNHALAAVQDLLRNHRQTIQAARRKVG